MPGIGRGGAVGTKFKITLGKLIMLVSPFHISPENLRKYAMRVPFVV